MQNIKMLIKINGLFESNTQWSPLDQLSGKDISVLNAKKGVETA